MPKKTAKPKTATRGRKPASVRSTQTKQSSRAKKPGKPNSPGSPRSGKASGPSSELFSWRKTDTQRIPDDEKQVAIDHICARLAEGGIELQYLCWHMDPRLPKTTLMDWRKARPEWNQAIDDAWEVGCAAEVMKMQRIAEGTEPLQYGHTTAAQRAKYRADVRRDRLRIHRIQWTLERLNRRYQNRQVLAGDSDAPLIPSKFEIQPVRPMHADDDVTAPSTDLTEEE